MEKSMRHIADDLGVSNGTLSKWCQDLEKKGERAFVGSGNLQPEAEELKRLHRENESLRQERDILKKRWPSFRVRRRPFSLY
ncbi:MAG TPA: transposase [Ktedonobacteraceae bacterium]|nr:transposase [Ktedonobacteraceae bacterium]